MRVDLSKAIHITFVIPCLQSSLVVLDHWLQNKYLYRQQIGKTLVF